MTTHEGQTRQIWTELLAAATDEGPRPARLNEVLVEGRLIVTDEQYRELTEACDEYMWRKPLREFEDLMAQSYGAPPKPKPQPAPAPIEVVRVDRVPVTVGEKLVVRDAAGAIHVMPKPPGWS